MGTDVSRSHSLALSLSPSLSLALSLALSILPPLSLSSSPSLSLTLALSFARELGSEGARDAPGCPNPLRLRGSRRGARGDFRAQASV